MKELERSSVSNNPEMVDLIIVEEIFSLYLLSNSPETFKFSRSALRKLFSTFSAKMIDIVFDKVVRPPIKDNESNIPAQGLD